MPFTQCHNKVSSVLTFYTCKHLTSIKGTEEINIYVHAKKAEPSIEY